MRMLVERCSDTAAASSVDPCEASVLLPAPPRDLAIHQGTIIIVDVAIYGELSTAFVALEFHLP